MATQRMCLMLVLCFSLHAVPPYCPPFNQEFNETFGKDLNSFNPTSEQMKSLYSELPKCRPAIPAYFGTCSVSMSSELLMGRIWVGSQDLYNSQVLPQRELTVLGS